MVLFAAGNAYKKPPAPPQDPMQLRDCALRIIDVLQHLRTNHDMITVGSEAAQVLNVVADCQAGHGAIDVDNVVSGYILPRDKPAIPQAAAFEEIPAAISQLGFQE